jgi:hypothetical protein
MISFKEYFSESNDVSIGININDKIQDFTGQILRGEKTIETRNRNSLKSFIGKKIGIIRTGKGKAYLVGYATIGDPVIYKNEEEFRKDYNKHLVQKDSKFDIPKGGIKYGYPLFDVIALNEPKLITDRGRNRVYRKIE